MKDLVKKIFNFIAFIISFFITELFNDAFEYFLSQIKLYTLIRKLGNSGSNFKIHHSTVIINPQCVFIGDNFSTLPRLRIDITTTFANKTFSPKLIIADNVLFNSDCHLACINRIEIGNNVLFASKIFITDHNHGEISKFELSKSPYSRPLYSKGPVIIKDNVWVGESVTILPNVTIGKNAIIGANSVVNKNIPENAIVAGNPAKIIKILQ